MKRIVLMTCIVGLLLPVRAFAQKVYMDDDKVILDMSVGAGMPAEAVTSVSKTYWHNTVNPIGTNHTIIDDKINDENHPLNATVFKKLEIAPSGLKSSGTFDNNGDRIKWIDAFTKCKEANHNGVGGWRLPTQRELMMMYIFKTALNNFLTIDLLENYWSSTESSDRGTHAFTVEFSSSPGLTTAFTKNDTNNYRARCVREILDPN